MRRESVFDYGKSADTAHDVALQVWFSGEEVCHHVAHQVFVHRVCFGWYESGDAVVGALTHQPMATTILWASDRCAPQALQ